MQTKPRTCHTHRRGGRHTNRYRTHHGWQRVRVEGVRGRRWGLSRRGRWGRHRRCRTRGSRAPHAARCHRRKGLAAPRGSAGSIIPGSGALTGSPPSPAGRHRQGGGGEPYPRDGKVSRIAAGRGADDVSFVFSKKKPCLQQGSNPGRVSWSPGARGRWEDARLRQAADTLKDDRPTWLRKEREERKVNLVRTF